VPPALRATQSASITCVKPSGNSSQLLDCASGLHARWAPYYVRNVRVAAHSPIYKVLKDQGVPMDLLGPAPAFASRVRGEYQWQVILRTPDLESLLDGLPVEPGWVVDVDPQSLL